jgi:hypothetical protein
VNRTFIFFRADMCSVSPAVKLCWPGQVIDLLNRLPGGTLYWGNMAEGACADFVGACLAVPEARTQPIEVHNLRLRWDRQNELAGQFGTREYAELWRHWLHEEIEWVCANTAGGKTVLPVLVDLDPPILATQGSKVLCRQLTGPEYKEGGLWWVAPGEGAGAERGTAADRSRE